jgi:hypothetical protein
MSDFKDDLLLEKNLDIFLEIVNKRHFMEDLPV